MRTLELDHVKLIVELYNFLYSLEEEERPYFTYLMGELTGFWVYYQ